MSKSLATTDGAIAPDSLRSAGVPGAGLSGSPSLLARWMELPLAPMICGMTLLAAALVNPLDVEFRNTGAKHSVGLDWQVALKLVVSAVAIAVGFLGFFTNPRVRQTLFGTFPGVLLVAMSLVFVATSSVALDDVANVCRAAALICLGYVLFIPTVLTMVRLRQVILMILVGLTMHMVVSWILYLGVPSIGVFEEELAGSTFVPRMAGTAHPNSVGRVGVLTIIISMALLRGKKFAPAEGRTRWWLRFLIVLGIATAIQTKSRTAMAAGIAAAIMMQLDRLFTWRGVQFALAGAVVLVTAVLFFGLGPYADQIGQLVVSMGTKTGDADELTSATGRTRIWAEAISLIGERPWTGWGLNSAPVLLEEFSQHTHNLLLHALFSGGILAGLFAAILVGWTFFVGLTSSEPLMRGVAAYVLVSGCFEDTVLETFPFSSTLLWFIMLLAPFVYRTTGPGDSSESGDPQRRGSHSDPGSRNDPFPASVAETRTPDSCSPAASN